MRTLLYSFLVLYCASDVKKLCGISEELIKRGEQLIELLYKELRSL